jgi:SNF2 family DNA or RNA helicase
LLLDFEWSHGKSEQAIGRVLRYGQESNVVNIYLFSSNTAIEKAIFEKQDVKLNILKELETGSQKSKIVPVKVKDIINILGREENIKILEKIHSK